jgi:hypothetical protein
MAAEDWTVTEIKDGTFTVSNEDVTIEVFKDFSGDITNIAGDFLAFDDLRNFISAAKLLEQALDEHYGGWR